MTDSLAENEWRCFGPPGTGKTTFLASSIRKVALTRRTSEILVASFTRTAANEIASRGLPVSRGNVGTLHSLAYRSIGSPPVADEMIPEWNKRHPELQMSVNTYRTGVEEQAPTEYVGDTDADRLLAELDMYRAKMVPRQMWPVRVQSLDRKWEAWKQHEGVVDFTDMIELALHNTEEAPGGPGVGYFDEVQDFTPLELSLVRHWGTRMDQIILAGDDDQCIYSFKGSTPDAFLDPPIPDDRKKVLDQSYRVPIAVHRAAEQWIRRVTRREEKVYKPRDEQGLVRMAEHRWQEPSGLVRDIRRDLDRGKGVMILTTCSYMLDPLRRRLRAEGVPFHNPYRSRPDWNPLKARKGQGPADRLLAYLILDERIFGDLSREWTGKDLQTWTQCVKKQGIFRRGAATAIGALPERTLRYEEIERLFEDPAHLERAVEPSLDWFSENLLAGQRAAMEYPIKIAQRRGPKALLEQPRVVIGTIHSVKGGQSDVVYLFPDLAPAGMREWSERGPKRDSVIRQMYVGMTRAREELVLCSNSSSFTVDPHLMRGRK